MKCPRGLWMRSQEIGFGPAFRIEWSGESVFDRGCGCGTMALRTTKGPVAADYSHAQLTPPPLARSPLSKKESGQVEHETVLYSRRRRDDVRLRERNVRTKRRAACTRPRTVSSGMAAFLLRSDNAAVLLPAHPRANLSMAVRYELVR